jgi:hypothetical protein
MSILMKIQVIAQLDGLQILFEIGFGQKFLQFHMRDVEINQSEESAEGNHVAKDHLLSPLREIQKSDLLHGVPGRYLWSDLSLQYAFALVAPDESFSMISFLSRERT